MVWYDIVSHGMVWAVHVRAAECRPGLVPGVPVTRETAVHTLQLVPNSSDLVFVCTGSAQAFIVTTQGQVVKRFASGKQTGGDFTCATISPQGIILIIEYNHIPSEYKWCPRRTIHHIRVPNQSTNDTLSAKMVLQNFATAI